MAKKAEQLSHGKTSHTDSQVVGFRIPHALASDIKIEAAKRHIPLNKLLAEMWQLYREAKRAG